MSRTIDAQQSPLRYRADMVRVNLVKLTTYTDRVAKTVDTVFYFAAQNTLYDYGNTSTDREFWPVLKGIGPLITSINHLPSIHDEALLRKPLQIDLSNESYMGERLINTLRDGHILEAASVELAQVILADRPTGARIDLSALDGDEHTVWYRGRVLRLGPITETTISLQCEVEIPEIEWLHSFDKTKTDPEHIGVRVAKVYGEAKKVACVNWDVGFVTTLAAAIAADDTSIELTDASGISSSGEALMGRERVSWTGKSGNTLTGVMRGIASSASNHGAGDSFVEILSSDAVFLVADHEVNAIDDVYCRNPYNNEIARITTSFTKDTADTTTVSGRTVASISFTQAQLRQLLRELATGPEILDDGGGGPPSVPPNRVQPLTDSLAAHVDISEVRLPAVADGVDADTEAYCDFNEGEWFYCRFYRPTVGWVRQRIVCKAKRTAGTGTIQFFKGREGIDTLLSLGSAQTLGASTTEYYVDTEEDVEWVSVKFAGSSLAVRVYECWQLVDDDVNKTFQAAVAGRLNGGGEVGSGNWFDQDDDTSVLVTQNIGVKFNVPGGNYHTQLIRMVVASDVEQDNIWMRTGTSWPPTEMIWPGAIVYYWPVVGGAKKVWYFEVPRTHTYFEATVTGDQFTCYEIDRQLIEYAGPPPPDIAIAGASVGYHLWLYADVDGYKAPSASPAYKAGTGNLMTKPCDIMRHVIEQLGGETIDTTSYDACATNLGSDVWGFDLRTCGETWEKCLVRLGFNARATIVPEEFAAGTRWKMLTANSSYQFPADSGDITEWDRGGFVEASGQLRHELASRFLFFYAPDWTLGDGEEAWTGALRATEDDNDLTLPSTSDLATAADEIGKIEAEPFAFHCIQQEATAKEIAGYYAHEMIRRAAEFLLSGDVWWEVYDVEVGDINNITPPWSDTAVKTRILGYMKDNATEQIELRGVEVE